MPSFLALRRKFKKDLDYRKKIAAIFFASLRFIQLQKLFCVPIPCRLVAGKYRVFNFIADFRISLNI